MIFFFPNNCMHKKQSLILWFIFLLSLAGMLGSMYFSNFGDPVVNLLAGKLFSTENPFLPCHLCWWARIWMYPIVIISAVGIMRKEKSVFSYIAPFGILGTLLTLYHVIIQAYPDGSVIPCDLSNPCTLVDVQYFGFITIPMMGLVAFSAITLLCSEVLFDRKK